mgnify:CR=1 FL=1
MQAKDVMKSPVITVSPSATLGEVARLLEAGQGVDLKDLNDILEFLKIFADRCHHGKEEELLFPALETAGIPRDRGPLGVMLSEHQSGRALIKDMDEALSVMARGEERAGLNFARQARAYAELLKIGRASCRERV